MGGSHSSLPSSVLGAEFRTPQASRRRSGRRNVHPLQESNQQADVPTFLGFLVTQRSDNSE